MKKTILLIGLMLVFLSSFAFAYSTDVDGDNNPDATDMDIQVVGFDAYCNVDAAYYPYYLIYPLVNASNPYDPATNKKITMDPNTWRYVLNIADRLGGADPYTQRAWICWDIDEDGVYNEGPYGTDAMGEKYSDTCRYISNPIITDPITGVESQANVCPQGRDQGIENYDTTPPAPITITPPQNNTQPPAQNETLPPVNPPQNDTPVDPTQPNLSTYYVSTTGNDANSGTIDQPLATIGEGLDRLEPGDALYIRGGTYTQAALFDIAGTENAPITISAYDNEKVVIDGATMYKWDMPTITSSARHLVINGLEIKNFVGYGIYVHGGASHITFSNIDLHNTNTGIRVTDPGSLGEVSYLTLINFKTHHNELAGFDCAPGPCNYVHFKNFTASDNGGTDSNTAADGIAFEGGSHDIIIENSLSEYNAGDGFDSKSDNTQIIDSISRYNARNGIKLWGVGGSMKNSLTYRNGLAGLVIANGADVDVINNVIAFNGIIYGDYGAYAVYDAGQTASFSFHNNIFAFNNGGFHIGNGATVRSMSNNIYFGTGNNYAVEGKYGRFTIQDIQNGLLTQQTGLEQGSMGLDPLFVAANLNNFRLLMNSPAIDKGTGMLAPIFDMDGNTRPSGNGYDIGAYEYLGEIQPQNNTNQTQPPTQNQTNQTLPPAGPVLTINCDTFGQEQYHGEMQFVANGVKGNACRMDGANDYISIETTDETNFGDNEDFSISLWVRTNYSGGYMVSNRNTDPSYAMILSSRRPHLAFRDGEITETYLSKTVIPKNRWTQVVMTFDRDSMAKVYVNGTMIKQFGVSGIGGFDTGAMIYIGSNKGINTFFRGDMDEVKIYDRVLSQEEIMEEYGTNN
ncbi:MAG: LamG-like jellyroll fold domain-containing protein [Candidatus Micrarchaeota archaeon]